MKTIRSFLSVMARFLARASIGRRGGEDDARRSRRGRPWRRVRRELRWVCSSVGKKKEEQREKGESGGGRRRERLGFRRASSRSEERRVGKECLL